MSTVNDEILRELRASLAAMSNDEFNSIMNSFEKAHDSGATMGFGIDSILATGIDRACAVQKYVLPICDDYYDEEYLLAA